jgi:hypothetical protein
MKKLPVGYSTLDKIINDNCVYVDKTKFVVDLVNSGSYYFLSRPRRFGKSLFLDTLKQAFLGNKELFSGLYLENNWDWGKVYPVIHISFAGSSAYLSEERLVGAIHDMLYEHAKKYNINLEFTDYGIGFNTLIRELYNKYNEKVVILIDEYDKPILDVIDDISQAKINREILKGLYSYVKDNDKYLKFVFLTGVSKFSKVSLFSGLNNLEDITLYARYADICGYTQANIEHEFAQYIEYGYVDLVKLKKWYNGYNFAGKDLQKVYNPFDILLFCSNNYIYKSYWFETATPTFLVKLFEKNQYFVPDLESITVSDKDMSTFDVDNMPIFTLLFQTGYLTIKEVTTIGTQLAYVLSYPNLEVKASLNGSLADIGTTVENKGKYLSELDKILRAGKFDKLSAIFNSHFASIPHDWYRNNNISNYEGFYASLVYSYFCALGYDLIAEDVTNQGRIDLTIKMNDKIIIIEFKLSKYGNASDSIKQIKTLAYADKYTLSKLPVYLIGMSFDEKNKNISDYMWEIV